MNISEILKESLEEGYVFDEGPFKNVDPVKLADALQEEEFPYEGVASMPCKYLGYDNIVELTIKPCYRLQLNNNGEVEAVRIDRHSKPWQEVGRPFVIATLDELE